MKVAPSAVTTSTHLSKFAAPSLPKFSACRPKQPRLLQQVCASSRGTVEATMQEVRSGRQLYIQQRDGNPEGHLAGQQVLFAHGANGDHSLVCMVMTCMVMTCMVMGKQPCTSPPCSPCCAAVTAALLLCRCQSPASASFQTLCIWWFSGWPLSLSHLLDCDICMCSSRSRWAFSPELEPHA